LATVQRFLDHHGGMLVWIMLYMRPCAQTSGLKTMRRGVLLSPTTRSVLLLLYLGYTLMPIVWLIRAPSRQKSLLAEVAISPPASPYNYVEIFRPAAFGEAAGHSTLSRAA
jgi:hypothetical protein